VVAILSAREKRGQDGEVGVEAVVEARRASRTWEPWGERASWSIGEVAVVVGGNKRVLINFRRKGMLFVGVVGESADWIICEVVV
jgi:hypothetical protein